MNTSIFHSSHYRQVAGHNTHTHTLKNNNNIFAGFITLRHTAQIQTQTYCRTATLPQSPSGPVLINGLHFHSGCILNKTESKVRLCMNVSVHVCVCYLYIPGGGSVCFLYLCWSEKISCCRSYTNTPPLLTYIYMHVCGYLLVCTAT